MSIFYYFLLLSSIPFYGYIFHLLKDIWIVFILLTNTNRVAVNIYRFLCKHKFSFFWEKFPVSSVQSLSHVQNFATPWTAAHQASLSITKSRSLLKFMSIESVVPSNHFILCRPLLFPPSIFPSIRVFSNESVFCIRWPKYWSFSSASVFPKNIQG